MDRYDRKVPKHAHGTINLEHYTSSNKIIGEAVMELYDRIIHKSFLSRRINISANNLINENKAKADKYEQIDLFTDYKQKEKQHNDEIKERELQKCILDIKKK